MKKYFNKKFMGVFMGSLGVIISNTVVLLMLTGDLQRVVPFAGVTEEMVFTLFVVIIGFLSLAGSISCAIEIDEG
jgi:hypothetical protein